MTIYFRNFLFPIKKNYEEPCINYQVFVTHNQKFYKTEIKTINNLKCLQ